MSAGETDTRRDIVTSLAVAMGLAGAGGVGWVLVQSTRPDTDTPADPSDIRFPLATLAKKPSAVVDWRGKPVLIARRSADDLATLDVARAGARRTAPDDPTLPEYRRNRFRSRRADVFVCVAVCTFRGCVVNYDSGLEAGRPGFHCPCCGSRFDITGRVYIGPAPRNLAVPPYVFEGTQTLIIGAGV